MAVKHRGDWKKPLVLLVVVVAIFAIAMYIQDHQPREPINNAYPPNTTTTPPYAAPK